MGTTEWAFLGRGLSPNPQPSSSADHRLDNQLIVESVHPPHTYQALSLLLSAGVAMTTRVHLLCQKHCKEQQKLHPQLRGKRGTEGTWPTLLPRPPKEVQSWALGACHRRRQSPPGGTRLEGFSIFLCFPYTHGLCLSQQFLHSFHLVCLHSGVVGRGQRAEVGGQGLRDQL